LRNFDFVAVIRNYKFVAGTLSSAVQSLNIEQWNFSTSLLSTMWRILFRCTVEWNNVELGGHHECPHVKR